MRFAATILFVFSTCHAALSADSAYTKLDLENGCEFYQSDEMGGSAQCDGYKDYPVYFSEGDLRQTLRFGHVDPGSDHWESFGQFNHVNNTIEWRLGSSGKPFATILRWFIDDGDPDAKDGQVLVVSTVGTAANPVSCIAGYVDARANSNANELARSVADSVAPVFKCGEDLPSFYGERGPKSGDPTSLAN